jgi:hypothetical protein
MKALKIVLLALAAAVWLPAQQQEGTQPREKVSTKATASISIRALESTVKTGSSIIVEVTMTNTSNYTFHPFRTTNPGEYYLFDVRRDGAPAPETDNLKHLKKPGSTRPEIENPLPVPYTTSPLFTALPPHQSLQETVTVSEYYDVSQPGKYTVQLQLGKAKSNIVTVTVEP